LILTIRIKICASQDWFVVITFDTRCHTIFELPNPWMWPSKFIIKWLIVGVWFWFVPDRVRRRRGRRKWWYYIWVSFTMWNKVFRGIK
jgi:hypothetical protein